MSCGCNKTMPFILLFIFISILGSIFYSRANESPEEKAERNNPIVIRCIDGVKFYTTKGRDADWRQLLDKDGKPTRCE
jgi:hypothetical protein